MNWICTIYVAVLFFVLTPGVLLSLPPKSSKLVVAATHAVVFALIWHFTHKIVWRMSVGHEGFTEGWAQNKWSAGKYGPNATGADAKCSPKPGVASFEAKKSAANPDGPNWLSCPVKDGPWVVVPKPN